MICPICKSHVGFSKVTEVSGPVNLEELDEEESVNEIANIGKFFNKNDYVILCNPCDLKGKEVEMEEE